MERHVAAGVLLVAAAVSAAVAGDEARSHTGVLRTEHFDVRYRPGSRAAAGAERAGAMAERDLARMSALLAIKVEGSYVLWLYDDVAELSTITGTTGNGGFSGGNASHVPYDDDQTRVHELVHVVAYNRLAKTGDELRNLFFAEGLSNALLEYVHGVHVHAVAKFYKNAGRLPPLSELVGCKDFYAWCRDHPGMNVYDVAGSLFRHVLDTYGVEKTKRWYTGTPVKQALGVDLMAVEKRWHAALDAYVLRPEVETLLRQRNGEKVEFAPYRPPLPPDVVGKPEEWKPLMAAELRPERPGDWKCEGAAIVGSTRETTWSACELGTEKYGDCVVHARVWTPTPCPIQLRLGRGNQAMLVNGTFLYRGDAAAAGVPKPCMDTSRRETDFVLLRRAGTIEIWIDGVRALTCAADSTPALVALAVCAGTAAFEDVRVRPLR